MTPRADVCGRQLIKGAAAAPRDRRVHDIITGQRGSLCRDDVGHFCFCSLCNQCFLGFAFPVICNFRSPICQALVLEIGETVQILEKSEGELETGSAAHRADVFSCAGFYTGILLVSAGVGAFYPKANKISL